MASLAPRGRGRRRTINEINMVPFIDVMLVLLIIFMVSAPLIPTGIVDLPTVGKSKQRPDHVVELMLSTDATVKIRVDKGDLQTVTMAGVADRVRTAQDGEATTPVVISADKSVRYEAVVKLMDILQRAGVQRVGLSVKTGA